MKNNDGTTGYLFENGVLDLGGASIVTTNLQVLGTDTEIFWAATPGSPTAIERTGLGNTFFLANSTATGAASNTVGEWYDVLTGPVINGGVTYVAGQRYKATATTTSGAGTFAVSLASEYWRQPELDERAESFRKAHLGIGDEATWDNQNWESDEPSTGDTDGTLLGWVR